MSIPEMPSRPPAAPRKEASREQPAAASVQERPASVQPPANRFDAELRGCLESVFYFVAWLALLASWGALVIALISASAHSAAIACAFGITARIAQAEAHHMGPGRKP